MDSPDFFIQETDMQIVMLDVMPVLWAMCAAAPLVLGLCGEYGMPARVLPAVCAGIAVYIFGFPPRVQVLAFVGMYICAAGAWGILRLMHRRKEHKKMRETPSE